MAGKTAHEKRIRVHSNNNNNMLVYNIVYVFRVVCGTKYALARQSTWQRTPCTSTNLSHGPDILYFIRHVSYIICAVCEYTCAASCVLEINTDCTFLNVVSSVIIFIIKTQKKKKIPCIGPHKLHFFCVYDPHRNNT